MVAVIPKEPLVGDAADEENGAQNAGSPTQHSAPRPPVPTTPWQLAQPTSATNDVTQETTIPRSVVVISSSGGDPSEFPQNSNGRRNTPLPRTQKSLSSSTPESRSNQVRQTDYFRVPTDCEESSLVTSTSPNNSSSKQGHRTNNSSISSSTTCSTLQPFHSESKNHTMKCGGVMAGTTSAEAKQCVHPCTAKVAKNKGSISSSSNQFIHGPLSKVSLSYCNNHQQQQLPPQSPSTTPFRLNTMADANRRSTIRQRPGTPYRKRPPTRDDPTLGVTTESWPPTVHPIMSGTTMTTTTMDPSRRNMPILLLPQLKQTVDCPAVVKSNSYTTTTTLTQSMNRQSDQNLGPDAITTATAIPRAASSSPSKSTTSRTRFMALHKEFSKVLARRKQLRAVHLELQPRRRPLLPAMLHPVMVDPMQSPWQLHTTTAARVEETTAVNPTTTQDADVEDEQDSTWRMDEIEWVQELERAWVKENAAVRPTKRKWNNSANRSPASKQRKQTRYRISKKHVDRKLYQISDDDGASPAVSSIQSLPRGQSNAVKDFPDFDPSSIEPRVPPDAFNLFSREHRSIIEADHPDFSRVAVLAAVRKMWSTLPCSEKQKYLDQESAAHSAYQQKMKAWKEYQKELEKPLASTSGRKRKVDSTETSMTTELDSPPDAFSMFRDESQPVLQTQRPDLSQSEIIVLVDEKRNIRSATAKKTFFGREKEASREDNERHKVRKQQQKNQEAVSIRKAQNSGRSKSYSFVLREPLTRQADGTFPQPRGRKPAGHFWDGFVGTWVPDDSNNNDDDPSSATNYRSKSLPAKVLRYGSRRKARSTSTMAFTFDSLFSLTSAENETPSQSQSASRPAARARTPLKHTQPSVFETDSSVRESRSSSSFRSVMGQPFFNRTAAKFLHVGSNGSSRSDGRPHDDVDASFGHDGSNSGGAVKADPPQKVKPAPSIGQALTRTIDNSRLSLPEGAVAGEVVEEPKKLMEEKSRRTEVAHSKKQKSAIINTRDNYSTEMGQNTFTEGGNFISDKSPARKIDGTFARSVGHPIGFKWNRGRMLLGPLVAQPANGRQTDELARAAKAVSEPRYIPCGCCVGCKMSTNCDSCLQCLLRSDASPETQSHFVCMQRICSAPRMNPALMKPKDL